MVQSDMIHGLQKTIQEAVETAIHNIQPQLSEGVSDFAEKAMDVTQNAAKKVMRTAKNNPWYVVGGAAALLVLAGLIVGSQTTRETSFARNR